MELLRDMRKLANHTTELASRYPRTPRPWTTRPRQMPTGRIRSRQSARDCWPQTTQNDRSGAASNGQPRTGISAPIGGSGAAVDRGAVTFRHLSGRPRAGPHGHLRQLQMNAKWPARGKQNRTGSLALSITGRSSEKVRSLGPGPEIASWAIPGVSPRLTRHHPSRHLSASEVQQGVADSTFTTRLTTRS